VVRVALVGEREGRRRGGGGGGGGCGEGTNELFKSHAIATPFLPFRTHVGNNIPMTSLLSRFHE